MAGKYGYKNKSSEPVKKKDTYEEVTKNFMVIMKDGVTPWSSGRIQLGALWPTNVLTGKRYKGINAINLTCISYINKLKSNYFISYLQSNDVAGIKGRSPEELRKSPLAGKKAIGHVTYWGVQIKDRNGNTWFKMENGKKRFVPTAEEVKSLGLKKSFFNRTTALFAFEDLDLTKIPKELLEKRNLLEKVNNENIINGNQDIALAEKVKSIIKGMGIEVVHDKFTKTPHYLPLKDKIVMPPISLYENDERYYHSLLHELTHATGNVKRLDRDSLKNYSNSDQDRAYEELVAELGGVFMAMELGYKHTDSSSLMNHASYINSWYKLLSDDLATGNCTLLHKASSDAEKAVEYMLSPPELALEKKKPEPESSELGMAV